MRLATAGLRCEEASPAGPTVKGSELMADLICVAFDAPDTADKVLHALTAMKKEQLIDLEDACVVVRPAEGEPQIKQMMPLTKIGALSGGSSGALWGALVGLLFLNPLAGLAIGAGVGAATGALAGSLSDYGINDDFIRDLGSKIKPNSSALFLLIRRVTADKVLERLQAEGFTGHVLQTNLTNEQETALRKAIGDATAAA
jgi:uncharacterized membrane protein